MRRSITARLDRLEPRAEAAWRRAWEHFAARVFHHVPDERLERAHETASDDEAAWEAFQREHNLEGVVAWIDARPDELVADVDGPAKLTTWPTDHAPPPPEPEGAWEALQHLETTAPEPDATRAAVALCVLGLARAVREVHS